MRESDLQSGAGTKSAWSRLRPGMTPDDVLKLLGEPLHTKSYGESVEWSYTVRGESCGVEFEVDEGGKSLSEWDGPRFD